MSKPTVFNKANLLFIILGGFFICNALTAQLISAKIFSLEESLGVAPFNWSLFGQTGSLQFTVGVLLWPIIFIMTDIINEYYGRRGVKLLSYLSIILISYAFVMIFAGIHLSPADWWLASGEAQNIDNMQNAYSAIFGQGMWIIIGSLIAFLVAQLLDVMVFHRIRKATGEKKVWLRATGSTLVSQLFDSFIVLYIAFVIGPQNWSISLFLAIGTVNYIYKFIVAIALTPVIYFAHNMIDKYLGEETAAQLKLAASE